jgi:hypothetical protein
MKNNYIKNFVAIATAAILSAVPVMADSAVNVYVNDNKVEQGGIILDNRTMVGVRGVFEELGYTADWDANTKTATLTNSDNGIVITLTNGNTAFTVNDKTITPDVPQQIVNDRFVLPLRAVSEAIGADVDWDSASKTAYIKTDNDTSVTDSQTIGNTTITSNITVPFVTIEAVGADDVNANVNNIEIN